MKKYYYHKHEEIQIVFKSDADLKDQALKKAKDEGMTLKAVLTMAMRAYVNDEMVVGMIHRTTTEESYEDISPPPRQRVKKIKKAVPKKVIVPEPKKTKVESPIQALKPTLQKNKSKRQ